MSEWLTYSLSDFLLFAPRTYYRLTELYNAAVSPGQLLALLVHVLITGSAFGFLRHGGGRSSRLAAALLAGCWLWVAWAYLLNRYATINWAAPYFAVAFAVQAALLVIAGTITGRMHFQTSGRLEARVARVVLLLAMWGYPLLAPLSGRPLGQAEIFALMPDPTVIGTLGILLTVSGRLRWLLLPIPLAWCAISGATLSAMDAPDALVMPAVGLLVLVLATKKKKTLPP